MFSKGESIAFEQKVTAAVLRPHDFINSRSVDIHPVDYVTLLRVEYLELICHFPR